MILIPFWVGRRKRIYISELGSQPDGKGRIGEQMHWGSVRYGSVLQKLKRSKARLIAGDTEAVKRLQVMVECVFAIKV